MRYKVIVVGGGPGGYSAAIRAAQMGMSVALIEKDKLGGTCLNSGCIPTKALVAAAETINSIQRADEFGVQIGEMKLDAVKLMTRKNQTIEKLAEGIKFLLQKNKVQYIQGAAKLESADTVLVEAADGTTQKLSGDNIIIATGSRPVFSEALGCDGKQVVTSNEALELTEIPKRLIIVGGGVIGCEFASIFTSFGSQVTIIELMPNILATMDREISQQMLGLFKRKGIKVKTRAKIESVQKGEGTVTAVLEGGETIEADLMLVSIGRTLNCDGIGLESVGVARGTRGEVTVSGQMETSVPGIYAIGDITGKLQLAHVASAQGLLAVDAIAGKKRELDYKMVPACVFTHPEVATVGLTADQAKEQGVTVRVAKFPMLASGKAQAMGETSGFVKVVCEADTGRILGVHIVGAHASDLIAEAALAVEQKLTAEQLAHVVHAHPTLAESLLEAAEGVYGMSIHGATSM